MHNKQKNFLILNTHNIFLILNRFAIATAIQGNKLNTVEKKKLKYRKFVVNSMEDYGSKFKSGNESGTFSPG